MKGVMNYKMSEKKEEPKFSISYLDIESKDKLIRFISEDTPRFQNEVLSKLGEIDLNQKTIMKSYDDILKKMVKISEDLELYKEKILVLIDILQFGQSIIDKTWYVVISLLCGFSIVSVLLIFSKLVFKI
jgi:hypothetical protein